MANNKLRSPRRLALLGAVVTAALILSGCGAAVDQPSGLTDEQIALLNYEGTDREAKLLECAADEPAMRLYSVSTSVDQLIAGFRKAYPDLKPVDVYSAIDQLAQVVLEERHAGAHSFDVYADATYAMDRTDELFTKFYTPRQDELAPGARGDYYVAYKTITWSAAYDPAQVTGDDIPTSYADFAKPFWKGRVGMGNIYSDRAVLGMLHQTLDHDTFNALAKNVVFQDTTSRGIFDQIVSGELAGGIGMTAGHAYIAEQNGSVVRWVPLDPVFVEYTVDSISNEANAPCTAALWVDWELSDGGGQEIYRSLGNGSPFGTSNLTDLSYLPKNWTEGVEFTAPDDPKLIGDYGSYAKAQDAWQDLRDTLVRGGTVE